MMIFFKFDNGQQGGLDADDEIHAQGYVEGLGTAARCLGARVWVTQSLPNEAGRDHDQWLSAEAWLEENR